MRFRNSWLDGKNSHPRVSSCKSILGLDERDDTGALRPDNRIDVDPAILDLQRGELIFPDLRPFAPAGIFLDQGMPQVLLPRKKYAAALYDTNSVSEIALSSKFFIEVRYSQYE